MSVKVAGTWRTPAVTYAKVAGVWRTVTTISAKVGGTWRTSTFAGAPAAPIMQHTGYGQFTITNYDPSLVYTATLVSGSGAANRTNGVYALTGVNSRFSVVARYATGAPASAADFMERKAYTYTDGGQSCSPNCGVVNGVNCFQGTGTCWCGSCAADGTICCGGCYGETCTDNPDIKDNYTGQGYVDQYGEWSKVA